MFWRYLNDYALSAVSASQPPEGGTASRIK